MAKAVISNRIYLDCPPEGFDKIKKALTYKLEHKTSGKGGKHIMVEIIRNYKVLPKNILSIPQGRLDLIPEGYEIIDKRVVNEMPFPNPKVGLRDSQKPVYDEATDSCFINALPGWGKTFTALHIARKLEQKTLIITHTAILRDQWIKEIHTLYGIAPGIIGGGIFDIDSSIVVGNVQSVTKCALQICKEFGTVIMDEAHHCPATTFTSLIDSMYSRYRIGLSGTMQRKDGKHVMFSDYFGHTVYKPPQSYTDNPRVKIIKTGFPLIGDMWVKKINNLLYDPNYQQLIAGIATREINKGHKVLIVASRVEFLRNVKELLGDGCALVTGETELEDREEIFRQINSGQKNSIAGSRQIFSEGVSVDILSCVILAEPIAQEGLLEQLIGRIMRQHQDKLEPLVIDLNFSGPTDKRQNSLRYAFYISKGWDVESI